MIYRLTLIHDDKRQTDRQADDTSYAMFELTIGQKRSNVNNIVLRGLRILNSEQL